MEWFPLLHVKSEVDKKGLNISDLNSTLALTMMKKHDLMTNLLMVDGGVKRAVAEKDLSEVSTNLNKTRIELRDIEQVLATFKEDLTERSPAIAEVLTEMIEFVFGEGEDADEQMEVFKGTMRELLAGEEYRNTQVKFLLNWLDIVGDGDF